MADLETYIKYFSNLHTDRGRNKYPSTTLHRAPHKPLLLLSLIDHIEEGKIKDNFIEISPDLGETFTDYWNLVMPMDKKGKIVYPFFHLRKENFWQLISKPGKEEILCLTREVSSVYQLLELVLGAKLDDDLFYLLLDKQKRNFFRTTLIKTYFSEDVTDSLISQSKINIQSFKYSSRLLQKRFIKDDTCSEEDYKEKARDQGFRKAVVTAYDHRCAFCGIRMRTPDGHTAVDGAHIIPWSVSKDDRPQNGISLCKLCHWTFDEGLAGINSNYIILISNRLNSNNNIAGHLITFEKREIFKPADNYFWPAKDSIAYHYSETFKK